MKTNFFIVVIAAILLIVTSCKNKQQSDAQAYMDKVEKTMKENPVNTDDQQKVNTEPFSMPPGLENIIGEWELVKIFGDTNGDHKVDPNEEEKATSNLKDYLKLNADGTCEYTIVKMKGTYKIETKDDGRKRLTMYDRTGTETTSGRYIISVTDKELVINRLMGGSDFEIFKRL